MHALDETGDGWTRCELQDHLSRTEDLGLGDGWCSQSPRDSAEFHSRERATNTEAANEAPEAHRFMYQEDCLNE